MNLRKFDDQCVQLTTIYDDVIEGICTYNDAEYNESEYGRKEESLKILYYMFYKKYIKKVISLEDHWGPFGRFSDSYGKLEEMVLEDDIDMIDEALSTEEDEHIIRILHCLEDHYLDSSKYDENHRKEFIKLLQNLLKYNENEEVIKRTKKILSIWHHYPKVYIDFDGVLLDTWSVIFNEYYKTYKTEELDDPKLNEVMNRLGWKEILSNSEVIHNSLEKVKKLEKIYDVCILSKINSEQEAIEKEAFLKKHNINNMCFVPYTHSKTKYVDSKKAVLIDDTISNLEEWEQEGGIAISFHKDLNKKDNFGIENTKYKTINDLLAIPTILLDIDIPRM